MQTSHRFIMVLTILSMLCLLALTIWGQEKKEYKPTEIQLLKLQNKQKDAIIAKQQMDALQTAYQDAQKRFQDRIKELGDEAETIKREQNWPKDLQFSPDTLVFSEPAKETKK